MAEPAIPNAVPELHDVNPAREADYTAPPARNRRRPPCRAGFWRGSGVEARGTHQVGGSGPGEHVGQSRVFRQLHVVNRDPAIHARARQHEENGIMSTGCGALPESAQNCNMEVISQMAVRILFHHVSFLVVRHSLTVYRRQ